MWWAVLALMPRLRHGRHTVIQHGTHSREKTHLRLALLPCEMFLYYTSLYHRAMNWQITGNGQFWVLHVQNSRSSALISGDLDQNAQQLHNADSKYSAVHCTWMTSLRQVQCQYWMGHAKWLPKSKSSTSISPALIDIRLLLEIIVDLAGTVPD